MKKILVALVLLFGIVNFSFWQSNDDTQIIDTINNQTWLDNLKDLSQSVKFKSFSSCQSMESVLEDFISKSWKWWYSFGYYWNDDLWLLFNQPMADSVAGNVTSESKTQSLWATQSQWTSTSTVDFSKTNVQVEWVDEPEILKTDWKYVYYYNEKNKKIYIIKSPLNIEESKIYLEDAQVVKTIAVPNEFSQIQLFIQDGKLVILAQRYWTYSYNYSFIDRSTKTIAIVYDISDINNLRLLKLHALDGTFFDARMINSKLYIVSRSYVNWSPIYPLLKGDAKTTKIDVNVNNMLPWEIDLSYTNNTLKQDVKINWKKYPYDLNVSQVDCNEISYVLPDDETLKKQWFNPEFAVITTLDINNLESKPQTRVMFGSLNQLHVSTDSIYVTNYFYTSYNFRCPLWAMCIMPYYRSGENTLIHKFSLATWVNYVNSNIIPWYPLNQYSMSEDNWYFRILTNTWYPSLSTHLFVLDNKLNLSGSLRDIEPGEQFKSSRFIWNKLYLVTFRQIDPLFVVDLANTSKPKIVGELKIPWYSTYLHPYSDMSWWVQYLIWLGYDTSTWAWGWTMNAGLKIDMYKVDFNNLSWDNIDVKQIFTKTLWDQWSWSEAMENPRMFVWDKNRKLLLLPLILQRQDDSQYCTVYYDKNWKETSKSCYPTYQYETTFAWIKWYNLDLTNWITETISKDYMSILSWAKSNYYDNYLTQWWFRYLNFRVGYLGDVIYNVNNLFWEFSIMGTNENKKIDF